MRIVRVFGFRLAIVAVVLVVVAAGWAVNSFRRSSARGDAKETCTRADYVNSQLKTDVCSFQGAAGGV
jgi:hypothetical protein